jgi:DNA-binding LytR/AlgR family response regulator
MKINCLIVDDELHARKLLADYISKMPGLELQAQCKNGMEAIDVLTKQNIDLMFLDIQMPDLTGVELLKTLKYRPVVIFTTAYSEYALEGYELDIVDYMLKPIAFERFVQGVNKAIDYIKLKNNTGGPPAGSSQNPVYSDYINLKADYKIYKVKIDDILYIEGLKEYVTYYTSQRKYIVLESLRKLEDTLPADRFIRVHKSYIIHMHRVNSIYGNTLEIGKTEIPIGKSYAESVKARLLGVA